MSEFKNFTGFTPELPLNKRKGMKWKRKGEEVGGKGREGKGREDVR
jgi:hypothetical protein